MTFGAAMLSWPIGVFSYLKMMANITPGIDVRAYCKQHKIRSNLLFITRPDLFTSNGMKYRSWYIASIITFLFAVGLGWIVLSFFR